MRKLKISLAIILVAVISLCNSSFLYAKNVYADSIVLPTIYNQSFEIEDNNENLIKPTNWQVEACTGELDKCTFIIDDENAYDGQKYYQVTDGEYVIKSNEFIDIDGEDDYVFGIKYKTSSLDNSCSVYIETYYDSDKPISIIEGQIKAPVLTDTWLDAQVSFDADIRVNKVKVCIKINAKDGNVGIDYAYANKDIIKINFGASISLKKGKSAIRFTGQVDKDAFDKFLGKSVSVGVLIMPTNAFETVGEFTLKGVSSQIGRAVIADRWNNYDSIDDDGYYEFTCVMENMHVKEALTLSLSARAFIKIVEDGEEIYFYSTFDLEDNSRSIQEVAVNIKSDLENYFRYDEVQRTIIEAYALGELPNFAN